MKKDKKAILLFLAIMTVLSCICYFVRIKGGDAAAGMMGILMFCPAITAIIVRAIFYRKEKILGLCGCKIKYILIAIAVPVLYLGVTYGLYWIINKSAFIGAFPEGSTPMLLVGIVTSLIGAAGEEIGWRGFLMPRLKEVFNIKAAILITGLIWAMWHFPLIIAGLYQSGAPLWYSLPIFTVDVVGITTVMAFLRFKSGSVLPAIILHAVHNYVDQLICAPLTKADNSAYFVGETGFITVAAIVIFAVIAFVKLKEKKEASAVTEIHDCEKVNS